MSALETEFKTRPQVGWLTFLEGGVLADATSNNPIIPGYEFLAKNPGTVVGAVSFGRSSSIFPKISRLVFRPVRATYYVVLISDQPRSAPTTAGPPKKGCRHQTPLFLAPALGNAQP